ncbi:hypothetical protein J6590_039393 [Homalodisca vitripennis]|nr:hypothetical protein J6590_039393 [Homalodisca vitripennis]
MASLRCQERQVEVEEGVTAEKRTVSQAKSREYVSEEEGGEEKSTSSQVKRVNVRRGRVMASLRRQERQVKVEEGVTAENRTVSQAKPREYVSEEEGGEQNGKSSQVKRVHVRGGRIMASLRRQERQVEIEEGVTAENRTVSQAKSREYMSEEEG